MNACELSMSIAALANVIAKNYDDEQIALLSAAFVQLGDTLETISAQRGLCAGGDVHKTKPCIQ